MRYIKSFQNDAAIQAAIDNKTLGKPYVALNNATGKIDWNTKSDTPDYSKMYLTIEALEDGDVSFQRDTRYSINDGDWGLLYSGDEIHLSTGDKVRFKEPYDGYHLEDGFSNMFNGVTLDFKVYGNIMSLPYGDNFIGQTEIPNTGGLFGYFASCFYGTKIKDASNLVLPATTLRDDCYQSMFMECYSLETPPAIPATTLANNCYHSMFCSTSITSAPALPATTLAQNCYAAMFRDCQNISYIKCLATNLSAQDCLIYWVDNISPTGTFVKKAGVTWPTGNSGIPSGWTVIEE